MTHPRRRILAATLFGFLLLAPPLPIAAGEEDAHEHRDGGPAGEHTKERPTKEHAEGKEEEHNEHSDEEHEESPTFTVEQFQQFGVRLAVAGPGNVDLGVELPGEVRPNAERLAHVGPRFPGVVREVRKRVGDSVRAGEVLAVIESENLAPYEMKAAFDGTVIDRHIVIGEAVSRDEAAFVIGDLSTVWVEINVFSSALPQLRVGQPVSISAGRDSLEAEGAVSYLTPIVDQATRTATARVVLPNPDGSWRPGLFVTAILLNPTQAGVVVPRRALQTLEGNTVVFVAEGEHLEPRRVSVGRIGRTKAEILSGLAAGESYVEQKSFLVKAELAKGEAEHEH